MNSIPIKENQKIKIIPDKIKGFSMGVIISVCSDYFVAAINDTSLVMPGLEPEILISSDDYMLIFTSKISKIENNNVFFSIPDNFKYIQKREYPRINTNLPMILKESDESQEIRAEIVNIGGGGMQISSPVEFKSNRILNTRFYLPNKKEINTKFEILRCEKETKVEERPMPMSRQNPFLTKDQFFLSGKFNTISSFDKTAIVQFCFKLQLELSGLRAESRVRWEK